MPELSFSRYEDVLFNMDTADFQTEIMAAQADFKPFLDGDLSNPAHVKYLKDFACDPMSRTFYQAVKESFPDLSYVRQVVESVFAHFHYYYPDVQLPKKVFTCVSGLSQDVPSVQIIEGDMVISLDWYLEGNALYDAVGLPKYLSSRSGKATIAKDVAMCLYQEYVYEWRKQTNLLDEMVAAGKADFFVEGLCPAIEDCVLLGYDEKQMQWVHDNEGSLWADIVGNKRLYSTGLDMYMTFLADGPFTQEYSNDAPARLGEFLGLRIIRSYMNSHNVSLPQLMANKDLLGIFQDSGYKPKK